MEISILVGNLLKVVSLVFTASSVLTRCVGFVHPGKLKQQEIILGGSHMYQNENMRNKDSVLSSPQHLESALSESKSFIQFDSNVRKIVKVLFPKTYRKRVLALAHYFATNPDAWETFIALVRLIHDTKSNSVSKYVGNPT